MSQATALSARMCQSTFFVLWQEGRRMFFIGGIQFRREAAGVPENSDLRALRRLWAVSGVHDLYVF